MLSDEGNFPEGFVSGKTHLTYEGVEDVLRLTEACLTPPGEYLSIGKTEVRR